MPSHMFGVEPNALESRMAISASTGARPFTISDSVLRGTPKPDAARVTESFSSLRHTSLTISPGCGGLCMGICCLLVVVLVVDVVNVTVLESERHPPVAGYSD